MSLGRLTGRQIKAAFTRGTTWGTPNSVTRQLNLEETTGFDSQIEMVDDECYNQIFLQPGEVGDQKPISQELPLQLRYENVDTFLALAMGSAAAPVVVSSQAASSLVAYQHVVTMADALIFFGTLAIDMQQYVLEIPSFKVAGYSVKVGQGGRMEVSFRISGAKTNYDSVTNTNSTVAGATAAIPGTRLFRKSGTFRMNPQEAGSLTSSDKLALLADVQFNEVSPLAEGDFVFGQDYEIEPDDNGFPPLDMTLMFQRMNTITSNSLAFGLKIGKVFKADWTFLGPFINSTTQYTMQWQFPALQVVGFKADSKGAQQVKPQAMMRARAATAAPTGMAGITRPMQLTIINTNSQNLLV